MATKEKSVLLTPAEVAAMFRVDPKTVTRWDKAGKLGDTIRTVGGHRRFKRVFIEKLLEGQTPEEISADSTND